MSCGCDSNEKKSCEQSCACGCKKNGRGKFYLAFAILLIVLVAIFSQFKESNKTGANPEAPTVQK